MPATGAGPQVIEARVFGAVLVLAGTELSVCIVACMGL